MDNLDFGIKYPNPNWKGKEELLKSSFALMVGLSAFDFVKIVPYETKTVCALIIGLN